MKRAHHNLEAWQRALKLVKTIYSATASFPKSELYGLTSQMRRAAVSIPSNIAEGAARETPAEFLRFLTIARGSLSELETQILIAKDLGYLDDCDALMNHLDRVSAPLSGLIRSFKARAKKVREDLPAYDNEQEWDPNS